MSHDHIRIFTIKDYPKRGDKYGRYMATSPGRAASKALGQLARQINLKNTNKKNFIVFTLIDITPQNSKGNISKYGEEYKYIGTRIELEIPTKIEKSGKIINFRYKNIVTAYDNVVEK